MATITRRLPSVITRCTYKRQKVLLLEPEEIKDYRLFYLSWWVTLLDLKTVFVSPSLSGRWRLRARQRRPQRSNIWPNKIQNATHGAARLRCLHQGTIYDVTADGEGAPWAACARERRPGKNTRLDTLN